MDPINLSVSKLSDHKAAVIRMRSAVALLQSCLVPNAYTEYFNLTITLLLKCVKRSLHLPVLQHIINVEWNQQEDQKKEFC